MFVLVTIEDVVQVVPEDFAKPSMQAIEDNIHKKYTNKVIQKIGLCICFYDLLKSTEGIIGRGVGAVNITVTFRMIVFRPFKSEVIQGKISESTNRGIRINLDFFQDVWIDGPEGLFPGCIYDADEGCWVWHNDNQKFYFDKNEVVRFRVEDEVWHDQAPTRPMPSFSAKKETQKKSPYAIKGSMSAGGLGPVAWW